MYPAFTHVPGTPCRATLPHRRNLSPKRPRVNFSCTANASRSNPAIAVDNVSFWWKSGRVALDKVSLRVAPGELAMLVGPNGCGKSTLLRVVRGLLIPSYGSVQLSTPCAFVHQNPDVQMLFPSVATDIAASVPKRPDMPVDEIRDSVIEAMEAVGLSPPEKYMRLSAHRLSGGQRQRAVVASALAMRPTTMLFDEATASMDPVNRAELVARVRRVVSERSIAALWVTHLLEELDVADTIIVMRGGKITAHGPRVAMMPLIYEMQDQV
ncbi:unnamed protein product [Chondrus crispus]|uniref:Probable ATP-dependent transporter ycf16 n=1 Tax=Chondrus crispus TaxID=2769 RepID=R7Q7C5_CHOCR|nr:unnamed protein product [Chondrus crispus]CDF33286.1 unnamed protein product [Chondrus crispus]|eukprot:XP_005713089.1 unnamed protein product [Chondrus crispus]